jgi:hypothetical protein
MPTKKTVKTPVAPKKTATHHAAKISNFEKSLDKLMTKLAKNLLFIKKVMELDFIKTLLSWKIIEDSNKWVKKNLEQIAQIS